MYIIKEFTAIERLLPYSFNFEGGFVVRKERNQSLAVAFFALAVSGCAATPPEQPALSVSPAPVSSKPAPPDAARKGWWFASFFLTWPEETAPAWHRDLLIAHRIAAPVLERYRDEIELWRFHRRAGRDQYGHRFSLYFYATPATAAQVFGALGQSPLLPRLGSARLLDRVEFDDTASIPRPGVEAASDPNWSPPVARTWPYFIKGVSEMWLHLIDDIAVGDDYPPDLASPEDLDAYYRQINTTITAHWQQEGRHALLHHLNALFGYAPLLMRY